MKQFAIIGLGSFAQTILEELAAYDFEILIIDRDEELINRYKDFAAESFIANVYEEEVLKKVIPMNLDTAIVDLGSDREVSILVVHYLKKMGLKDIIVKAESKTHGEILKVVGASYVMFPEQEAAQRLVPLLASRLLFNYMPVSEDLVLAEMTTPDRYVGKTLVQANLRKDRGLNVVAIRKGGSHKFDFFDPLYQLGWDDVLLVAGKPADVQFFSRTEDVSQGKKRATFFTKLFQRWKK